MKALDAYLATALAHVRLLARVNTLMHRQGRTLDELLAAVGVVAHMGADAAVDTFCTRPLVSGLFVLRPKLLTMTCEVTASGEALAAGRTRKGFRRARIGRGAAAVLLTLRIRDLLLLLLLGIGVLWGVWNVVVVVQHGHGGLHLRRRRVAQAAHVLGRHLGVCRQLLLWLL